MRIISCVPSISELIFDLNPDFLIGRTKFCIHPNQINRIPQIGGTKSLNIDKIKLLQPDLIFSVMEENEKSQIEELSQCFRVKTFDIQTLDDSLDMVSEVGKFIGKSTESQSINYLIQGRRRPIPFFKYKTVLYLIWQKPWMTIGGDTFINSILTEIGLKNIWSNKNRYPEIFDFQDIKNHSPDFVFLSSEPYPFKEKHREELQKELPLSKVVLVDGTYFSWYGSRIAGSWAYFEALAQNIELGLENPEIV
jgi:ABC-type Fe3+-hydroxamate transport system substrate-binding protein